MSDAYRRDKGYVWSGWFRNGGRICFFPPSPNSVSRFSLNFRQSQPEIEFRRPCQERQINKGKLTLLCQRRTGLFSPPLIYALRLLCRFPGSAVATCGSSPSERSATPGTPGSAPSQDGGKTQVHIHSFSCPGSPRCTRRAATSGCSRSSRRDSATRDSTSARYYRI